MLLSNAANSDAPKLRRKEANTRGDDTTSQKCIQPEAKLRTKTADSGMSTNRHRYTIA
jgi:hypothetical protein